MFLVFFMFDISETTNLVIKEVRKSLLIGLMVIPKVDSGCQNNMTL